MMAAGSVLDRLRQGFLLGAGKAIRRCNSPLGVVARAFHSPPSRRQYSSEMTGRHARPLPLAPSICRFIERQLKLPPVAATRMLFTPAQEPRGPMFENRFSEVAGT